MRIFKVHIPDEIFNKLKEFLLEEHEIEYKNDAEVLQELFFLEGGMYRGKLFDERGTVKVEEVAEQ